MFVTSYFGLLRVGELTERDHVIKAKDVHIGKNKNKIMILLHTSKTHWRDSKPQIIKINSVEYNPTGQKEMRNNISNNGFCPFQILQEYVGARKSRIASNPDEPFFVFRDRSPVSALNLRVMLRAILKEIGLDNTLYNVHSFRIGHAGDLLSMNLSVETIKKLGRWKSNIVYNYLRG